MIGSAQARHREGVLQHGTLPLHGDLTRITAVLSFPDEISRSLAAERVAKRATTAELVLGYAGVEHRRTRLFFCLRANPGPEVHSSYLDPEEIERAAELEQEKYSHPSWTDRV